MFFLTFSRHSQYRELLNHVTRSKLCPKLRYDDNAQLRTTLMPNFATTTNINFATTTKINFAGTTNISFATTTVPNFASKLILVVVSKQIFVVVANLGINVVAKLGRAWPELHDGEPPSIRNVGI